MFSFPTALQLTFGHVLFSVIEYHTALQLVAQLDEAGLLLDMCVLFSVIEYHTTRVATATLQRVVKFRTHLLENTVLKVSIKSL